MDLRSEYKIVRVGVGEVSFLQTVADEVFDEGLDPDLVSAFVASPERILLVVMFEGCAVAQCTAFLHRHVDKPPTLYIDELGTTPEHRRRGLARALLNETLRWAAQQGCASAWLATETDNHNARALYQPMASQQTDAVVFELPITDD